MSKDEMRIEFMALGKLERWPQNPKLHADADLDSSMDRFGYVAPLLIDEGTGRLVAGHGRIDRLVARKLAGKPPPDRIRTRRGEWFVPVVRGVRFGSEEEAEAYLLADNRIVELGGWNDRDLAPMLERVRRGAAQLDGVGFTMGDVEALRARLTPAEEGSAGGGSSDIGDEPLLVEVNDLRAPFPWFGGKSRAASIVWGALGDVPNYVEPFYGSGAILLARPGGAGKTETVNDLDRWVANFWRAVADAAEEVAGYADWPVNEADLHARHRWLLSRDEWKARMQDGAAPDYFDAKIAGWWVWGLCAWIGSGWCSPKGNDPSEQMPHLSGAGQGLLGARVGSTATDEVSKLPHLGNAGRGGRRGRLSEKLPHLQPGSREGRRESLVGDDGGSAGIVAWMKALQERLRRVRIGCGDWRRVLTPAVTTGHGLTGVVLDPPYAEGADNLYGNHDKTVSGEVRSWAIEHGNDPEMRIAFCGYAGEHADEWPAGWRCVHWKAQGGYGSQNGNPYRERIWLSPHCLRPSPP